MNRITFTKAGLEEAAPHVKSQMAKLDDVDLEAIKEACIGRFRSRNESLLTELEWCGKKHMRELWERDSGRRLVIRLIDEILRERRPPVDMALWKNIHRLA